MRLVEPADLAPGDRVVVAGTAYAVTSTPRRDAQDHDVVWVDIDLGGLDLPVRYTPDAVVETELPREVAR